MSNPTPEKKTLTKVPMWGGSINQKNYEFYAGRTQLKTRKAISSALNSGKEVTYNKIQKRAYKKGRNDLSGSKLLACSCGKELTVDINTVSVKCVPCTNLEAIQKGGFLHSKSVASQEPKQEKETSSEEVKKTETERKPAINNHKKKSTKKAEAKTPKNKYMTTTAVQTRFDNLTGKKGGYFVRVFGEVKSAKRISLTDLLEKAKNITGVSQSYLESDKFLMSKIRYYAKLWKNSQLATYEDEILTYITPKNRS